MIPQQLEKQSGGDIHSVRSQETSSGHARVSRAAPGRGLTINTLLDNMTRMVVSSASGFSHVPFEHVCFSWTYKLSICSADDSR